MLDDFYKVEISPDYLVYEFQSVGPKGVIHKTVRYTEHELPGIFNLGFGDVDLEIGFEDDLAVTNNGDCKKILRTVASTIYLFTEYYPGAIVIAFGSSKSRTRLYQIGIGSNIEAIEKDFAVWGYHGDEWIPFEKGIHYNAFLVKGKL